MKLETMTLTAVLALALSVAPAGAAERNLADGLAAAGAATALKGNLVQAKDLFFKALAHDDSCPDALFELAKLVDKEGDLPTACDLYTHAALVYAQEAKPGNAPKRAEAEKRAKALNPAGAKLSTAYEDYASDLDKIVKKLPDPLTEVSALERVNGLQLPGMLPPDKLPKFYAVAQAAQEKKNPSPPPMNDNGNNNDPNKRKPRFGNPEKPKAEGATAPDVEKELKALGWGTVTGVWVKKSAGVYEATDAKLEAPKINGAIDFTVVKGGGDGTVKATVRTEAKTDNGNQGGGFGGFGGFGGPREDEMLGYGVFYRGKDFKDYGYGDRGGKKRFGGGGNNNGITELGKYPLSDTAPKHHFMVKIDDNNLDCFYNGNSMNHSSNTKFTHSGTFAIDVNGTVTIETPRCTGQ